MHQILGNIVKNPIAIIVLLVLVFFLLFSSISVVSNVGTWLGFETKDNIEKKLVNTEAELDKAVVINKANEEDRVLNEKIDTANKEVVDFIKETEKDIIKNEKMVLEELNKISNEAPIPVAKVIDNNPVKVVFKKEPTTITDNQSRKLTILLERSKQLKGEVQ